MKYSHDNPFSPSYEGKVAREIVEHRQRYPRRDNTPKTYPKGKGQPKQPDPETERVLARLRRR